MTQVQREGREHLRMQLIGGIGQLRAHGHAPCVRVERLGDVGNAAMKGAIRE